MLQNELAQLKSYIFHQSSRNLALVFGFLSFFKIAAATACTCFVVNNGMAPQIGCSYDWIKSNGEIHFNSQLAPYALPFTAPRYASVTFNQRGQNHPLGGINSAGLVVHSLQLEETQYPEPEAKLLFDPLQFSQQILNQYRTLEEVKAAVLTKKIGITPIGGFGGLHYFICQKNGDCILLEFLKGKTFIHDLKNFPVITNLNFTETQTRIANAQFLQPESRVRADQRAKNVLTAISNHQTPFSILDTVTIHEGEYRPQFLSESLSNRSTAARLSAKYRSQWQTVFDPENLRIKWRTYDSSEVRELDLTDFFNDQRALPPLSIHSEQQKSDCIIQLEPNSKVSKSLSP